MHRLSPQQVVSINLPLADGAVQFEVVAVIDTVVALEPLESAHMPNVPGRLPDCFMAFEHNHRLAGLKGQLYARSPGDWRFKVTDALSRKADDCFRIRVCAPITVAGCDERNASEPIETNTVNFGVDGTLLNTVPHWSPPQQAKLTLSLLGDDEPIEGHAILTARVGLLCEFKYQAMSAEAHNRLGSFIIDYQRDILRRRKAWHQSPIDKLDDDVAL